MYEKYAISEQEADKIRTQTGMLQSELQRLFEEHWRSNGYWPAAFMDRRVEPPQTVIAMHKDHSDWDLDLYNVGDWKRWYAGGTSLYSYIKPTELIQLFRTTYAGLPVMLGPMLGSDELRADVHLLLGSKTSRIIARHSTGGATMSYSDGSGCHASIEAFDFKRARYAQFTISIENMADWDTVHVFWDYIRVAETMMLARHQLLDLKEDDFRPRLKELRRPLARLYYELPTILFNIVEKAFADFQKGAFDYEWLGAEPKRPL